jgi:hypothetical protein
MGGRLLGKRFAIEILDFYLAYNASPGLSAIDLHDSGMFE